MDNVQQLIKYVVETFADNKSAVEYKTEENENAVVVTVLLDASDMGKVIGMQGKLAKALRTLVRSLTPRESKKYVFDIKEKE